ncbi:DNA repair protein RecN [Salidesulfovibrio brasiliensis]
MLELLRIRNLALIEDAEVEFGPGMNTLTGETGAGKSFILRAVDFITGEKMDRKLVRPGAEKAEVEALFILPEGETVIRRELSAATGRSRLFINDRLGSQDAVRELKPKLVIHTSQHGQQKLLSPAFQSEVLDSFLPDTKLLEERDARLAELKAVIAEMEELDRKCDEIAGQREFLDFQKREIAAVDPQPGEEDELEQRKSVLKEREQAGECFRNALDAIHGESSLLDALSLLSREMGIISRLFPDFEQEHAAVEEFRLHLYEIDSRLRKGPEHLGDDDDDMTLDDIEQRLYKLSQLRRKLGRNISDLVDLAAEVEEKLSFLDACSLDRKTLERKEAEIVEKLSGTLETLNKARKKAAKELSLRIEAELSDLGFSEHVKVHFEFTEVPLHDGVTDLRARIMWTPNPGQPAQPLDKIASGGELSRLLLALTSLRRNPGGEHLPTLIFDEVDAGIGGLTLGSVGRKLSELAERQQMILITHWPQLAGLAERHFSILKEVVDGETFTRCTELKGKAIRQELVRMAGGGQQGEALADKLLNQR